MSFAPMVRQLAAVAPEQRIAALAERLERRPRCAVARYLLGCHFYDQAQPALAVRQMMVAHHAEPALESAALLVFAGLGWAQRGGGDLLGVLLETWDEFRRPQFDRTPRERALLDAFSEPVPPTIRQPLAGRLWRLPVPLLRRQLTDAVGDSASHPYPLLGAAV